MDIDNLFLKMLKIRKFEEGLLNLFRNGKISGTTHTYIGQEANAVSIFSNLEIDKDSIWSNHRCHGHYLEYTQDYKGLLREILGKSNGVCGGFGGSQHLNTNNFYSSGIQGAYAPIAVGFQYENSKIYNSIGIVFLGDGTLGQGVLYESLNIASLFSVPVLFVIENNGISQTTLHADNFVGSVDARFEGFGIKGKSIESTDLKELSAIAKEQISLCRSNSTPRYLHINTVRLEAHSKGDDTRSEEDLIKLKLKDPLVVNKKYIRDVEMLTKSATKFIDDVFSEVLNEAY